MISQLNLLTFSSYLYLGLKMTHTCKVFPVTIWATVVVVCKLFFKAQDYFSLV